MTIIWSEVPDMERDRQNFLSLWTIFLHFHTPANPKNQNFEKMKNPPGDITTYQMCIINENRMMYGSWDMKCDGHFLFSFWTAFCPFTSLTALKLNFEKGVTIFHLGGLKDCEPEISHILAELFKKCLQESCFSDCWRVSSVVPVLKNVGKGLYPISLLSVVSKVFEKLVNNRIVNHLEKCGFFLRSIWF